MTRITLLLILLVLSGQLLQAAVYKGQRIYIKKCRICHQGGEKVATRKTMQGWQTYFNHNGAALVAVHLGSTMVANQISMLHSKGKASSLTQERLENYFKSGKFQKRSRHLRDFLVQYAKDSGNVPACN